jgi:hypothetical protein
VKHLLTLLLLAGILLSSTIEAKSRYVHSYHRRHGHHVNAHHRSSANHSRHDNYSSKGRTNPYTGKAGSRRVN